MLHLIYGFDLPYTDLLERSGLETLEQRRIAITDKFALKCSQSERFAGWFKPTDGRTSDRVGLKYKQERRNLERTRNNPIDYYTRRLNQLEKRNK